MPDVVARYRDAARALRERAGRDWAEATRRHQDALDEAERLESAALYQTRPGVAR